MNDQPGHDSEASSDAVNGGFNDGPKAEAPPRRGGRSANVQIDPDASESDRTWAVFMHLGGLLLAVGFFAPLVMWLIKKDDSPFLDDHGREAICFQVSLMIYAIIAAISMLACIGFVLVPAVAIFGIIASIMMAIRANHGEYVRYPMCIRFF